MGISFPTRKISAVGAIDTIFATALAEPGRNRET